MSSASSAVVRPVEGGEEGGKVIAVGTPEQIVTVDRSHTGRYLRDVLAVGRTNAYGSSRN